MNEEKLFVRAVIRTALLYIAALNNSTMYPTSRTIIAKQYEDWVWGKVDENGSTTEDQSL